MARTVIANLHDITYPLAYIFAGMTICFLVAGLVEYLKERRNP